MKPRLLDLFCGAGGAAMGYHRAGFEIVGVDINPQPNYPFEFEQADALELPQLLWVHWPIAAIHASPPCHDHSSISRDKDGTGDLLARTLAAVKTAGLPWIIENVEGPTVRMDGWWTTLCGSMFGLEVRRHRRFGASFLIPALGCNHAEQGRPWTITGHGGGCERPHSKKPKPRDFWRYMEMPWMEGKPPYGVTQAIPPAYTEHIGSYLLASLRDVKAPR